MPIGMSDGLGQLLNVLSKTRRHTFRGPQIHRRPRETNQESAAYHSSYDTVRLVVAQEYRVSLLEDRLERVEFRLREVRVSNGKL